MNKPKIICEVGSKFNKLTVIAITKSGESADRKHNLCECKCDCGGSRTVYLDSLIYSDVKSCGCDITMGGRFQCKPGEKYNLLTVLRSWVEVQNGRKRKKCECLCDCGHTAIIAAATLRSGATKSCGCLSRRLNSQHPAWSGHGEISGDCWGRIKNGSNRRNRKILFEITIEQAWNLFLAQDRKCAISGVLLKFSDKSPRFDYTSCTASLDRIDSKAGYTIDNVQWVHKIVNSMKWDSSDSELIEWCKLVAQQHPLTVDTVMV